MTRMTKDMVQFKFYFFYKVVVLESSFQTQIDEIVVSPNYFDKKLSSDFQKCFMWEYHDKSSR